MVAANQAKNRLLRILCFIVAFALLALIVAAVMIFLIPFLDESPINQGISILFMVLLALISHVIFRRGHFRNRSTVGRRAIIAINAGLAGGALTGGCIFGFLRGSVRFPDFLSLILVASLVAVLIALVTYRAAEKLGRG